jgi:hypothetical protein
VTADLNLMKAAAEVARAKYPKAFARFVALSREDRWAAITVLVSMEAAASPEEMSPLCNIDPGGDYFDAQGGWV